MNVALNPGAFASVLLMLLNGLGLPLGVPPEPEDPLLARVAPDNCLIYTSWSGMAEPDPDSTNQLEQMLAEAEVRRMLETISQQLDLAAQKNPGMFPMGPMSAPILELAKAVLTSPTAIFVEEVRSTPNGMDVRGGILMRADDDVESIVKALEQLQEAFVGQQVQRVKIGEADFYRLQLGPDAPPITWGTRGRYVVVGVGEGTVEQIFARAATDPPSWLVDLKARIEIDRVSTTTYIDVAKLRELLLPMAPPETRQAAEALGLMELKQLSAVTGLDETLYVGRTQLEIDGPAKGLFALADGAGLEPAALQPIPQDALAAVAFRLDAEKLLDLFETIVLQIDPRSAGEMQRGLEEMETEMGIPIRGELLKALGDVWTLSAGAGDGGLFAGLVATVQLRDQPTVMRIHDQLLQVVRRTAAQNPRAPEIIQTQLGDQTAYALGFRKSFIPLAPAWCITDTHLVVSLFPTALKSYLARKEDAESLATIEPVDKFLTLDPPPLTLVYVDTKQVFRAIYPTVQIYIQLGLGALRQQGIELDPFLLPAPSAIERHLLPSVMVLRRTETGIEFISHLSTPGLSLGTAIPMAIGLLVPALHTRREVNLRTTSANNMKQIGLALHNYHDTFKSFPPSYSADADGKPLLSWRVYILPFIEQGQLYDQFHLDEPWDSPHNRKLIVQMPTGYSAPGSTADPGKTVYLGVHGPDKIFVAPKENGRGRFPSGASIATITDGTSNTAMVVETSDAEAVIWTKPGDFEPDEENPARGLIGLRPGGFNVLLGDCAVRFIPAKIDAETLRNLFTKNDGNPVKLP